MAITIKGTSIAKADLNPYSVGVLRLNEAHISIENFERADIEYIGRCSINRRKVVLGKVGNNWAISSRSHNERFCAYYVIEGKKVTTLHKSCGMKAEDAMKAYECRDLSKPLSKMNAFEVFNAGRERKPSRKHAPKTRLRTRLAYAERMEK